MRSGSHFYIRLNMDMAGAALATVIGQVFSFLIAVSYLRRYKTVKILRQHMVPHWEYTGWILRLGAAPAFNQIAMMAVQIVMNKSLTYYGANSVYGESIPLACAGIVSKVNMVFFSVIIGISHGMQPIASFNYGAGQFDRVHVFKVILRADLPLNCRILLFSLYQTDHLSERGRRRFAFAEAY